MTSRRYMLHLDAGLVIAGLASGSLATASMAEGLAKRAGDVVLTIDGAITNSNEDGRADFDMAMLRALPSTKFSTTTQWTEGKTEFEGVPFKDLFAAVGASGTSIKASALNDYIADVDFETLVSSGAILAYHVNGADISVRDKGPLWIMFPFDEKPQLKAETIYSQSVWQLRKMTILK